MLLSALLACSIGSSLQASPLFTVEPAAFPKDLGSRFSIEGFVREGHLYIQHYHPGGSFPRYRLWNPDTSDDLDIPEPTSKKLGLPFIIDDHGNLLAVDRKERDHYVLYKMIRSSWVKINPADVFSCEVSFENSSGDKIQLIQRREFGPKECLLTQKGVELDLKEHFKRPNLTPLAMLDDRRAMLYDSEGNNLEFFFYENGSLVQFGRKDHKPGYNVSLQVDRMRGELLVNNVDLNGELYSRTAEIFSPKGTKSYKSPSGKDLARVKLWLNGWSSAYEMQNESSKSGRSVVIINNRSYYLDDLVENFSEQGLPEGFHSGFAETPIIGPQGYIITSMPVKSSVDKKGIRYFLLKPLRR